MCVCICVRCMYDVMYVCVCIVLAFQWLGVLHAYNHLLPKGSVSIEFRSFMSQYNQISIHKATDKKKTLKKCSLSLHYSSSLPCSVYSVCTIGLIVYPIHYL